MACRHRTAVIPLTAILAHDPLRPVPLLHGSAAVALQPGAGLLASDVAQLELLGVMGPELSTGPPSRRART